MIDHRNDTGPFDIIGDVHGCFDELVALLERLGYAVEITAAGTESLLSGHHPGARTAVFVGDFADRGPRNLDVLKLVMGMCRDGDARAVIGNHDWKLRRWLDGRNVQISHGLDATIRELKAASEAFRTAVRDFLTNLPSHLWLDRGRLVVAHAGLPENMHGRDSKAVHSHAIYGDTTGEQDSYGFPVRRDWGRAYSGEAHVVYGHTPMLEAEWVNRTICIDTGCVMGGKLTALRWPEKTLVAWEPKVTYWPSKKPLGRRTDAPLA